MSVMNEGFRKNRLPEPVPVEESVSIYQNPDFIALCVLVGGTIFLTTGVAFAFGLPVAAIVLGSLLLIVGFALGFRKDN